MSTPSLQPARAGAPEAIEARLSQLARDVLARCRARGASQAELALTQSRGLSVGVRLGEVETIEYNRDRGLALTVYFGQRKASASTADLDAGSIETTIDSACAMARHTEADPHAGLADAARMAREQRDFDLWHPVEPDPDAAIEIALRCEAAGRDHDARISNSGGASLNHGSQISVYANSHGFVGSRRSTHHSLGVALIAGHGASMQRDYWHDVNCDPAALRDPECIGRRAARRTLARLDPRPAPTGRWPVLFAPEMARGLFGHLAAAVSGGALRRRASFLLDAQGQRVLPGGIDLIENPLLWRGQRSSSFDAEGVATRESALVADGTLQRYVLGSYSARALGLESTANAGGLRNLIVRGRQASLRDLLRSMQRGLLVTELMGQGVNLITGDYSRGAAGLWIEDGAIAWPVSEATIAGNLRDMLLGIRGIGDDVDTRSHLRTGSVLVDAMTVAAESRG